ncbi:uncharacterized protein LOC142317916 [Lycorma delicatula]|uniref:uncharacterized protein LOC142317916 n=1 Tax=Lycorma delicatula TaxID=130591 RepID=UPI003F5145FE
MVPAFALLFYVWEKLIKIEGKVFLETAVVFEDVWVHEMLTVSQFRTVTLLVTVQHISGKFEVTFLDQAYKAKTLLSGYCSVVPSKAANIHNESLPNDGQLDSTYLYIQSSDFYDIFKAHGYSLDGGFQNVEGLYVGDKDIIGKINWTGSWVAFFEGLAQIIIHLKLQESSEGNAYVPLSIQKLQINPTEFFSLNKKEISVCMNTILNTVYCDGVKLTGYTLKPLNLKSSLRWSIQSPVFIPYGSTKFKSVDEFLTACIQVTSTNKFGIFSWRPYHKSKVIILENNQQTFKFRNELQNKVETVTVSTWDQLAEYPNTFLVTTIYNIVNEIKDKKCLTTYQFYLIQSPVCFSQEFQLFNSFSLIFEQQFNDVYLILLKQKEEKLIEYIQGTNLNRKELLSCLRDTYKKTSTDSILAVIINKLSIMSSYSIIQDVAKERYISQIRFIFTIDEEQSTYNSPLFIKEYEEQLKKGLLLNIFKDNQWCSLVLIDSTEAKDSQNVTVPLNCSKGIQFSFIGFNPRDFNYGSQLKIDNSLGPLEFSGLLHNKEKVMGFVSWDLAQLKTELKPVDEFLWRVPDSWSLEDASTVTFSYSVAFYSLKLLMKLKPSECVLIHSGFSTLGNAAISVALQIGSTVFTTVSNEIQKQNLLSQFPKLNAERVLQLENNWFEEHILSKTSGKGANVIICTLAGDSFHASLRCLAISGRIMQLNKADIELGHKIGMSVFVKNTSLYGFDAENLFMAPIEWKKAIHLDVKEGIKKGFVKPLKKQVYPITSNKEALKNVLSSNGERKVVLSLKDENKKNTNELISSNNTNNKSCIIVGSDSGVWLDLIQSLFKNGISSFVVALNNNHYISASSSRKLKELASQHGISIQTLSIKQLDSVQHAENILLNTLKYSIIEFIIVVLMESGSDSVQNLDLVSRKLIPDVKFIYLMGSGEKLCESRVNNGFHATMITNSSENIDPSLLTSLCESICLHSWKHKFCVVSQLSTDKDDGNDYSKKLLENYLPSGLSELKMIDYSKNTYSFSEIRSLSPRMGDLPSSTPIFILPGLSLTFINSLTLQLMVPVFCAEIPQKILSAKEAAESLIGPLLEIQSNGPYNIIGETWSGSIALELARLLEYAGHTVLVILLTATPHTFQYLTKTLGSYDCVNFKNTIFSTIFQLQSNMFDEITGFHDEDVTWDDCVTKLLSKEKFGTISKDEEKLHNSLNFIHNRILCTLNYEMHPLKKGNIVIIHPDNCLTLDCDLNKLYGDNVTLHIMEESNHKVMLSSIKTADLINELIHFIY